jgi:hypothetical protein
MARPRICLQCFLRRRRLPWSDYVRIAKETRPAMQRRNTDLVFIRRACDGPNTVGECRELRFVPCQFLAIARVVMAEDCSKRVERRNT